jgi:two-component system nitrate/nitrite sensor histidine kinase NarX
LNAQSVEKYNQPASILIVDGQPQRRSALAHLLTEGGFQVMEAATGAEGLNLVREHCPDLALVDAGLPDGNGIDLCRQIRDGDAPDRTFAVLVSEPGVQAGGFDAHIVRPISDQELMPRVELLLRLKRTEDECNAQARALHDRRKELKCLYSLAALVEEPGITLEGILQGTVDLLPPAWQSPGLARARLVLEDQTYQTEDYGETSRVLVEEIKVQGQNAGYIEVGYPEEGPTGKDGPFLDEERHLLHAIAERLGRIVERMRTQTSLKRSEERYVLAQRSAAVGSWDWDVQSGDLYWSEEIEPLFGFEPGAFGGSYEAFLATVHPEDRALVVDAVNACIQDGEEYTIEHRIIWPDGSVRWVAETGDVLRDGAGQAVRMLGMVQDVTERKLAAAALRRERDFRAAIVDTVDALITVLDPQGRIVGFNRACEEISGYTFEEVRGHLFWEILLLPQEKDRVQSVFANLTRTALPNRNENRWVTKDGQQRLIEWSNTVLTDTSGAVEHVIGTGLDVTERRHFEDALRQAKEAAEEARHEEHERRQEAERRRRIAESLAEVLAVLNSNRSLNEVLDFIAVQARDLLGSHAAVIYRLEDETGSLAIQVARGLIVTYVSGTDIPAGLEVLQRAMAAQEPVAVSRVPGVITPRRTGSAPEPDGGPAVALPEVYRSMLALPIAVQDKIYGGMLLYYARPRSFSDDEIELAVAFGDQVALAIENAQLRDQVQQAAMAAERDRLARELHDAVTQTLFSASLIAQALPRIWEHDQEEGRRGLEELRRLTQGAAAEMRTLLHELRPASLTERPLGELLRHLVTAVAGRTRIPVAFDADGECTLPPAVQLALYRIAQESLNNVAKHAEATQVWLSLRQDGDQILLTVKDNGCGFDPDAVLPDRLGLCIMHERAASIGAMLAVRTALDAGTEVTVRWQTED